MDLVHTGGGGGWKLGIFIIEKSHILDTNPTQ